MFGTLTANAPLYIFTKGENPKLEIGQVQSISKPHPTFSTAYPNYTQPLDMVIDLMTVRIGEETIKFESLPSNSGIHTYNNGSVVISDTKDTIVSEIENAQRTSKSILDSVGFHENMVSKCNEFLSMLNPQIAENARRDEKLGKLENDLAELKQMLSMALGKSSTTKTE